MCERHFTTQRISPSRFLFVIIFIHQAGSNINNNNSSGKLNYKHLIKYYNLLQNWQKNIQNCSVAIDHRRMMIGIGSRASCIKKVRGDDDIEHSLIGRRNLLGNVSVAERLPADERPARRAPTSLLGRTKEGRS